MSELRNFKRFALSGIILAVLLPAGAYAADLPEVSAEIPVQQPINAATYDWSGLYVGGHIGFGFSEFDTNAGVSPDSEDIFGGLSAGYNLQSGPLVYGVEGDINLTSFDPAFNAGGAGEAELNYFGTVTARLGYVPIDRLLTYVEGGYAFGEAEVSIAGASDDNFHNGYVLGAGAEYALTENILSGVEYNFVDLEDKNFDVGGTNLNADNTSHTVKLNLKYKF